MLCLKGGDIVAEKLTVKQKAFSDYYIQYGNATRAYAEAGYKVSKKSVAEVEGCKLLKNPKVKKYIEKKMNEISSSKIASAEEVLEYLTSVMRGETKSEVVVVENVGDFTSKARNMKKAPDERERLKAADLIGKRYGIFTEKIDLNSQVVVSFEGEDELED